MDDILTDFSEAALIRAIECNLVAFLRDLARSPHIEWHEGPELSWYITGVAYHNFNRIVRARFAAGDTDRCIEEALSPFRSCGVPMIWHTGPETRPADLEARLSAFGLECAHREPGMAADLSQLPEVPPVVEGLEIEPVSDIETARHWCRTAARSFGMPDWVVEPLAGIEISLGLRLHVWRRLYLGRLADQPVATSLLFLGAGVAGLYSVTTVPEARRKGIGEAMTIVPLLEARSIGYRIGTLHASALGRSIYLRLGFRELCRLNRYVWRP